LASTVCLLGCHNTMGRETAPYPMTDKEEPKKQSWEELIKEYPEFEGVIHKKSWDFIGSSDKKTTFFLGKMWRDNLRANVKNKLWKKHGGLADDCVGLGRNKAVIGVGAGSSLNKNIDLLKELHDFDGCKEWKDRNFIIVASNHQFKPLLNMGIIPDFVVVTDASDVVLDQLVRDIPEKGNHTVLLPGLHCSPKVLRKWSRQGREIRFYTSKSEGFHELFEKLTNKNMDAYQCMQGGNVLNTAWAISLKFFGSTVFMALGNDLSFPLKDTIEEQRETYYADGDYSSNAPETGTGRDEASTKHKWMSFNLKDKILYNPKNKTQYDVELDLVGTNQNLWVYKTWLESNVLGMGKSLRYQYYNCTEGGIAGVMCKDDSNEGLMKEENWYLMDEICPKRWRTRKFKDAISEFLMAKEALCRRNPIKSFGRTNANIRTAADSVASI